MFLVSCPVVLSIVYPASKFMSPLFVVYMLLATEFMSLPDIMFMLPFADEILVELFVVFVSLTSPISHFLSCPACSCYLFCSDFSVICSF